MQQSDAALFTAGHGFYQFAIPRNVFDRSLYYNLLLQPTLAIPDHYFLQGEWLGRHLADYPSRDSWIENGLRNGFISPFFRREASKLSDLLSFMEDSDRRGFSRHARKIAERIDRTPFQAGYWSSADNSASFGAALIHYLNASEPPIMEMRIDPDDFVGFWGRSREWVNQELAIASDRSSAVLNSEGILLSQLIQVSGERLLGRNCDRISSVDELLSRVRTEVGASAERDLRAYYTCVCELYNRSLADTLLAVPNSPRWEHFIAAMDLWRDGILMGEADVEAAPEFVNVEMDAPIRLPRSQFLRSVSGDVLLTIRSTQACDRYFESLAHWRAAPHDRALQEELVESLCRYSQVITKQVGQDVGMLGFKPQFISKVTDVTQVIEKIPGVVQGFLAVGATAGAAGGASSTLLPVGFFSLFCLQTVAKYYSPSEVVDIKLSTRDGVRVRPDVTISRA
ncbi:hypothetical protein [Actinomadura sp. 7K534]|uniref:hypothetical protein n=1 Tax=Actinomadura sp. 7K534 TaxID=2530366 RepID=UPI00104588BD|nr:hypothetical protein [Actinomadura sp. 7K534]TDB93197.1 hypothetical protein E1266_21325 [Actinomadura sp. 7K534]